MEIKKQPFREDPPCLCVCVYMCGVVWFVWCGVVWCYVVRVCTM